MDNPFVYSRPVPTGDLVDRDLAAERLLSLARGGHNTRLSAPRRYGKTSLLRRVLAEAERGGTPAVYVNFYGILSLEDAVARMERAYADLRGPLANWLTGVLRTLRPTFSVPGVSAAPELESDNGRRLLTLLDLPRRVFQRGGERVLIAFDEFQEVLEPRVPLDGAIRSVIEHHAVEASYVFAGSHPGLMAHLFGDSERPFFGQARPLTLGPLADEDLASFIADRFERTGRSLGQGPVLGLLLDAARGHPQRAMLLAHHLWEATDSRAETDETTFLGALTAVNQELEEAFDRTWRGIDDGERRTLAAVAVSGGRPTGNGTLAAVDLARTTAHDALRRLVGEGHLVEVEGTWRFVDPLFGRWVAEGRAPSSSTP